MARDSHGTPAMKCFIGTIGLVVLTSACAHYGKESKAPGGSWSSSNASPPDTSVGTAGPSHSWTFGGSGAATAPAESGGAAPPAQKPARVTGDDLLTMTLRCALGTSIWNTGATSIPENEGANAPACATVAHAAIVPVDGLYNLEDDSLAPVRVLMERRLTREASVEAASNTLALFDRGVDAAREARAAQSTLIALQRGGDVPLAPLSAHSQLDALARLGRGLPSPERQAEAEAWVWVIAANRFVGSAGLRYEQKALPAEPLFALLGVQPLPPGGSPSSWDEALAAASRSAKDLGLDPAEPRTAIGGGPPATDTEGGSGVEPAPTEPARPLPNAAGGASAALTRSVEAKLRSLEAETASPELGHALEDAMARVRWYSRSGQSQ